jgi:hypothetical protein
MSRAYGLASERSERSHARAREAGGLATNDATRRVRAGVLFCGCVHRGRCGERTGCRSVLSGTAFMAVSRRTFTTAAGSIVAATSTIAVMWDGHM